MISIEIRFGGPALRPIFQTMCLRELKALANDLELSGYAQLRKRELINLLLAQPKDVTARLRQLLGVESRLVQYWKALKWFVYRRANLIGLLITIVSLIVSLCCRG